MENPIKIDDLGVPLFLETSIWIRLWVRLDCQQVQTYPTTDSWDEPYIYLA